MFLIVWFLLYNLSISAGKTETFLISGFLLSVMVFWSLVVKSLYFFLPAYLANMAPIFVQKAPFLDRPVWERKLGKNKTWRGVAGASLAGVLVFLLQKWLFKFSFFNSISLIDYNDFSVLFGFLLGFGAILGDGVKSYYKRKEGIKPGESWKPWDQLDFVIGGLVLGWLIYVPRIEVIIILVAASFFLHVLFCRAGYAWGIKKEKF